MKALLIENQSPARPAFESQLLMFDSDVQLARVETAGAAREAMASGELFDFIFLDLQLADGDGFALLAELCHSYPAARIIGISGRTAKADVVRAIELGAAAFVPRRGGDQAMLLALRTVASGHIYVPLMVLGEGDATTKSGPVQPFENPCDADIPGRVAASLPTFAGRGMTPRQHDVLTLLLQGHSNKLMARALNLSVETIKDHVTAVLRTLNVNSRTQAVLAVSGTARTSPPWHTVQGRSGRGAPIASPPSLRNVLVSRVN
ncbi:MAG: response regulator transcription factor [Pseudomonadota bacterium]|nr:response regulator transcription factor [Pseudomonadota bacterium]